MTALDESGDEVVHLGDARRGPRLVGRGQNAERLVRRRELELDAVGHGVPGLELALLREHLVIDVGDVANEGDGVPAVGQPPSPEVVDERAAHVPDVGRRLHGRPADVHAHVALDPRIEVDDGLLQAVKKAHGHRHSLSARC